MKANQNKSPRSGRFLRDKIKYIDPHKFLDADDIYGKALLLTKTQELIDYINALSARIKRLERIVG